LRQALCDATRSLCGDLTFVSSLTFTNPPVIPENEALSSGNYSVILSGGVSDGGSGYGMTKCGTGTLT